MSQASNYISISGSGGITQINGNTGSAIPVAGIVTISGDGTVISTSGSGSTLSITSTAIRVVHSSSGDATSASNAITIVGSGSVTTSASGSTVTIAGASTSITLAGNSGSISGSSFTLSGSGPLSTAASGSTVAFTTTAANVIHSSSGDATASSNAFTIVGSGTVSTTATGSTVTITGSSTGTFTWNNVTGATQTMAVSNGYVSNDGATLVTFTLPSTASVGQMVAVQGSGTGLWTIAQNSGQTIHFNAVDSTTGVGGSVASTSQYDSVTLICNVANTDWVAYQSTGNLNVT